jgi:hypothetical protein
MIASFGTDLTADCCEFAPTTDQQLFVCGTYQLQSDGVKRGRIYLFDAADAISSCKLLPLQSIDTAAILDVKWYDTL